ncbi:penicillin-binding protein 2 [Litoribrevibacter albus]|uniref:Peptidoglycan D,D-transpeptidase MrdA n=1 Tax=Litoribrevibacter albus TaxID=1473156 RepID=A0AA37W7C5_9GAMM|nr:penicillin-binding protein 2 [Litoribrevibacter albus]GLQ32455.1 penicillin-binding protein [Litoribrevibacter albus]
MEGLSLHDHSKYSTIFFWRVVVAICVVLILISVLLLRMYHLQVVEFQKYQIASEQNRVQVEPIAPTRGLIFDRNGVLLAENTPNFSLGIIPEKMKDKDALIASLRDIIKITDKDVEKFNRRLKERRRPLEPVAIRNRLTEEEIATVAVELHRYPAVSVDAKLVRSYPLGAPFAHVVGYVARINEKELKKVDATNYQATNHIGKLGVERFYESSLHGMVGLQKVEADARGRVLKVIERVPPTPGKNLRLSLDSRLQQTASKLLDGRRGAVVAIEPKTGGILALVSEPSFDPNLFVLGIDHQSYGELRDSKAKPLFNRALKGQYPPGSTIKPMLGVAGVESGVVDWNFSIMDYGQYQLKNDERIYRDWKRGGHGRVDLRYAVVQSCDTYFYELAFRLGVDRMSDFLAKFGFGDLTSLDISEARRGLLPTRQWKRGAKGLPWFPGDSLNMGLGQGYMLVTPLQLAAATAIFANKGKWVRPRLTMDSDLNEVRDQIQSDLQGAEAKNIILKNPENWDRMFAAMKDVMHSSRGTARASGRGAKYKMAGKTGTAQVLGIAQDEEYDASKISEWHRDHAWFMGFAPIDDPQIAVAVLVENGGGGSHAAAPVARKMFDAHILGEYLTEEAN